MAQSSTASTNDTGLQEVEIKIGTQAFTVRPTYKLLARIERVMDTPARELGARCYAGTMPYNQRNGIKELGLIDVVNICSAILADDPKAPAPEAMGEILMAKGGYLDLINPLGEILTRHIRGSEQYEADVRERAREAAEAKAEAGPEAGENPPLQTAAE